LIMRTYVAAIDCGTTAIKTAIFNLKGRLISLANQVMPCLYYKDGRIEQDPGLLLEAILNCLKASLEASKIAPRQIAALSLSTQRATLICTDKQGKAISKAISWQDLRGAEEIAALRRKIKDEEYYDITGLPNNPAFSLGKILQLKKHHPGLFQTTAKFSLVHDFVLRKLGCDDFYLDWSNASLTGMFDIAGFTWSEAILSLTGIPADKLPTLVPSGKIVGKLSPQAAAACGLLAGTPLVSGGGDHQCAGIGAGALAAGILEITLGTAGVSLCYSNKLVKDKRMRLSCCAHAVPGKWEMEGLQNSAGASLQWLLKLFGHKNLSRMLQQKIAALEPGAGGIIFYPYLAGASAPYWNPEAKGIFLGLTHQHSQAALSKAVMEGVSLETRQILEVFTALKIPITEIRLTGGYTNLEIWNQIQADIYGKPVATLVNPQASLQGAAILAAQGIGAFCSFKEATANMVQLKKTYNPNPEKTTAYDKIYKNFCAIYQALVKHKIITPKLQ
jgi:xylulokinase